MPIVNYIQTVEPTIPMNGGIIRPIRTSAPKGTLMNATFPAAMGNRFVAVMRVYDAVLGCLNQAIEGGLTAAGSGQAGIISVASIDERTGPAARERGGAVRRRQRRAFGGGRHRRHRPAGRLPPLRAGGGGGDGDGSADPSFPVRTGQCRTRSASRRLRHAHRNRESRAARHRHGARARPFPLPALGDPGWQPWQCARG